jgi:glutamate 5-kinase
MSTKIVAARLATSAGVTTVITRSSNPGNIANIVRYLEGSKPSTPAPSTPHRGLDNQIPGSKTSLGPEVTLAVSEETGPSEVTLATGVSFASEIKSEAPLHTRFIASDHPIRDRNFWLLHGLAPHGIIYIDAGAHRALVKKAGLLAVGVVDVEGNFAQQEAARLVVVERIPKSALSPSATKQWTGEGIEVGRALVNYSAAEIARIKGVQSSEIHGLLGYADSEYVALRENISLVVKESRPVTPSIEI